MEYRRRRSHGKRQTGTGSGALRAVLLLLIFGAAAYLILGTDAGRRIKEGYAASIIGSCLGAPSTSPMPTAIIGTAAPTFGTPEAAPAPTPTPAGETVQINMPGVEIYMIQMGCYNTEAECLPAAETLRSLGAAGYVYNDGGALRLIAAAFSDRDSADGVRDRLIEQGHESTVFELKHESVDLLVTADHETVLPIRTAFSFAGECADQLDELSVDFDVNSRSVEYALGVLSELRINAENASAGIEVAAVGSETLSLTEAFYGDLREYINETAGSSGSRMEFSSSLKELRIKAALRYAYLLDEIEKTHIE